ncbi:hypothetical protein E2C01_072930 [Portunus trituberculatus]|uniref:Uncharacterized protein n=1 Tax=Portunus trituberculatus TaxID=210409 RepID=A0A5B7ICP4_PORTR|nr:hypothetical protein [Portunus trituberculatus]
MEYIRLKNLSPRTFPQPVAASPSSSFNLPYRPFPSLQKTSSALPHPLHKASGYSRFSYASPNNQYPFTPAPQHPTLTPSPSASFLRQYPTPTLPRVNKPSLAPTSILSSYAHNPQLNHNPHPSHIPHPLTKPTPHPTYTPHNAYTSQPNTTYTPHAHRPHAPNLTTQNHDGTPHRDPPMLNDKLFPRDNPWAEEVGGVGMKTPHLQIRGLVYETHGHGGRTHLLDNISLEARGGEVLAVLATSGKCSSLCCFLHRFKGAPA